MTATEDNIIAEPVYFHRTWQCCDWKLDGKTVFHHRTYTPWMKDWTDSFWLNGWQHTAEALLEAIEAHGLDPSKYEAYPEPYGDGFFPACALMEDALNYHNAVSCGFTDEELNLITK